MRRSVATVRLAIIAPTANSLVRFKGGRYAFAEARRAARRNGNIFAAITMPPANLHRRAAAGGHWRGRAMRVINARNKIYDFFCVASRLHCDAAPVAT